MYQYITDLYVMILKYIYIYIIYLSLHNRSVCNDIEKSPRYVKCKSKVLHNIFYPYLGKLYNIMGLLWEFLFLY